MRWRRRRRGEFADRKVGPLAWRCARKVMKAKARRSCTRKTDKANRQRHCEGRLAAAVTALTLVPRCTRGFGCSHNRAFPAPLLFEGTPQLPRAVAGRETTY